MIVHKIHELLRDVGLSRILYGLVFVGILSAASEILLVWLVAQLVSSLTNPNISSILTADTLAYDPKFFFIALLVVVLSKFYVSFYLASTNQKITANMSVKLVGKFLTKSYESNVKSRKSELASEVISYVDRFSSEIVGPLFRMVVASLTMAAVLVFGLLQYPKAIMTFIFVLGLLYLILYKIIQKVLSRSGSLVSREYNQRVALITEIGENYKYIKATRSESFFTERFIQVANNLSFHISKQIFLGEAPRPVIEGLFIALFFGLLLGSTYIGFYNLSELGSVLGVLMIVALRTLPQAQQIFVAKSQMRFSTTIINRLLDKIIQEDSVTEEKYETNSVDAFKNLEITANNLSYSYDDIPIIRNLTFCFSTNDLILIRGRSGSGKSTLLDLILQLRTPTQGDIQIKTETLDRLENFSNLFSYVPQKVFLLSDTIESNVVFGNKSDRYSVEECLRLANVYDEFISLSDGLQTRIGDGGVAISGGQEQRLALARALYANRPVLILDEPTASLDKYNEHIFLSNLKNIKNGRIVLLVSHSFLDERLFTKVINLG